MTTAPGRLAGPGLGAHPAVRSRRMRELALLGLMGLIPLAAALAISLSEAKPSLALVLGLIVGMLVVFALLTTRRLEVSVTVIALYLGLIEGPLKLGSGGHQTVSVVRDILIFAVALGALHRLLGTRQRISLPPLSGWVLAFGALVLVQALNPATHGVSKALGGIRQQGEWLPFFFFGYALMRSKRRLRQMFVVLGVIALANGVISTYQTKLGPAQLASWGPGYRELVYGGVGGVGPNGGTGITGRTYASGGESHVRPPGLGSDAGFSGGVGVVAIPATLVLLAGLGLRRRWPYVLLCLGALAGVATGEGRLQVLGALLGVLAFAGVCFGAGRAVARPLTVMLGVILIAVPVGAVFATAVGGGTFSRYSSLAEVSSSNNDGKLKTLQLIPKQIEREPFGAGLGSVGAAAGLGGVATSESLETHKVDAETQYNFITDELGLPGLLLWVALTLRLLVMGLTGLKRIADAELRIALAALLATLISVTFMGLLGPTMASNAFGPYFWFSAGTFAYWFVTKRPRGLPTLAVPLTPAAPVPS